VPGSATAMSPGQLGSNKLHGAPNVRLALSAGSKPFAQVTDHIVHEVVELRLKLHNLVALLGG
jgi:hypothetical protein